MWGTLSFAQRVSGKDTATIDTPEFFLVGTSRIGERHSATLQLSSGEQVVVVSEHGGSVPLTGWAGYSVLRIESGRVEINQPSGSVCDSFPHLGVVCEAENIMTLELRVRAPVETTVSSLPQNPTRSANDLSDIPAKEGSFIDRIQAAAAQRGTKPEVPDGMLLIETSAGFQLIPED